MCGITGFFGSFDDKILTRMSNSIAHRGPDDDGKLIIELPGIGDVRVGLAHRRLSIIDLSKEGHQPMTNEDSSLYLIYNGELYNYLQLRAELISKGHVFRSLTDSEVFLHLYEEYGRDMLEKLNGIFAFAIWDVKKQELFVARDGIGVKPLYYCECDSGFVFGSEMKALLKAKEVPRDIDIVAMHYYIAYLWAPAPYTMLKQVKKLEPGFAMVIRNGHIADKWCFYDLPYNGRVIGKNEKEIIDLLESELFAAVNRQMMSDVPVGAFLSGGLDSSAVVAMMRKVNPEHMPTCYCIGFADSKDMEGSPPDLPYAKEVARYLGVNLKTIIMEPGDISLLDRMIYLLDEPTADPAPINSMLIAEHARRDGIKVLLSGAGGDDIFSGYRRHQALQVENLIGLLPKAVRSGIAGYAAKLHNGQTDSSFMNSSKKRRLVKLLHQADISSEERLMGHFLWSSEQVRRSLYNEEIAHALDGIDTLEPLKKSLHRVSGETSDLNKMLYLEGKHFLADHNLNYTDKTSMASGVEVRVPLLDLELVKLAASIPPALKQKRLTGKYIFKRAMEKHLPKDVIYRPKSGFGAPLRRWLHKELEHKVTDLLSVESLNKRGLFDPLAINALIDLDRNGRVDGAYTLFAVMCIELWCRIFIDQP